MKPVAEDDLEPLITECPSCRTRFRVAETQLQSARGRVRCGACLTVFNGVEHLIWDEVEIYSSDEEAQSALDDLLNELEETVRHPNGPAAGAEPLPPGNSSVEADMPLQPDTPYSGLVAGDEPAPSDSLAEASDTGTAPVTEPVEDDPEDSEVNWVVEEAEAIIELIEEPPPLRKREAEDDRPPQGPRNVVPIFSGFEEDAQPTATVQQEEPEPQEVTDEVTDEVQDEVLEEAQEIVADLPETWDSADVVEAARDSTEADRAPAEAAHDLQPVDDAEIELKPVTPAQHQDDEAVPTPLEVEDATAASVVFGEPSRRRPWMWLAIAAAVAGILLQVFWYQFDDWAKDPTWRPVYASACSLLGCELPVQSDLSLLRTKNLLVRSDPNDPGVLLVNAVIVNEAQFAQPFPVLELRFTDLRGGLVAGRRFQPLEYLAGEGSGMELMPARTPVQIELGIEDPGPEAVNYTMKIR